MVHADAGWYFYVIESYNYKIAKGRMLLMYCTLYVANSK